jgi:hypothetical protein
MRPVAFQCSGTAWWTGAGARLCIGLAGALVVALGVSHGVTGLLAGALVVAGPVCWAMSRPGWRAAWHIVVSDQHIEARRIGALRTRLAWESVGEVQHFAQRTIRGPVRFLRLVSIDRQRDIVFNDRLPGFDALMRAIEAKIRHVGIDEPSSWGRLLWASPPRSPRRSTRADLRDMAACPLTRQATLGHNRGRAGARGSR